MIAWTVLTLMIAVACVGLAVPLLRPRGLDGAGADANLELLKQQLRDVEAQACTGALTADEVEPLKAEIMRRALAEGPAPQPAERKLGERKLAIAAIGVAAGVALAATLLYGRLGRPDLAAAPAATPQAAAQVPGHGDVAALIAQLEAQMARNPGDPEGWRMLAWSYMQTGRNAEAATAYGRAAALSPGNAEYLSAEGEALTRAGDGTVTAQARGAFQQALAADPGDPRARYFLALYKDQQGDHAGAMSDWLALLKSAPADAPWRAEVREFVQRVAAQRGVDVNAELGPPAPGPSKAQVDAASNMPPADQQAMIAGMVDGLAARLKANPKDPDGWVRLMRSRMVLGQPDQAASAYKQALAAFAPGSAERKSIDAAARGLAVPGA